MNLQLEAETPEAPSQTHSRSPMMSGLIIHAVLFTAIMSVQIGMLNTALTPQSVPVVLND